MFAQVRYGTFVVTSPVKPMQRFDHESDGLVNKVEFKATGRSHEDEGRTSIAHVCTYMNECYMYSTGHNTLNMMMATTLIKFGHRPGRCAGGQLAGLGRTWPDILRPN